MTSKPFSTALFHPGHRLPLPGGFWLQKDDENHWQIGGPMAGTADVFWAMQVQGNVPVGRGGSMDHSMLDFSNALCAAAGIDASAVDFPANRVRPLETEDVRREV